MHVGPNEIGVGIGGGAASGLFAVATGAALPLALGFAVAGGVALGSSADTLVGGTALDMEKGGAAPG